ncbi:hypothetical protein ABZ467_04305 [Streptomyces sp. NPDC005727]|uniref:hypothetical protein n=1 Tax=Streptomyces sp. NPDC005727 TaxID=3157053 RepID=UPI0033E0A7EF
MSARLRILGVGLAVLMVSCNRPVRSEIPDVICGTRIDPALTRQLGTPTGDWHEYNRFHRAEETTAPCLIRSSNNVILNFRFSWRPVATDLMYLAKDTGSVSRVTEPRDVHVRSSNRTVVGTDGAISQTACKNKGGKYFTLTLQLPQVKLTDQSHRNDIEKFMRAYFPATLKTLGCA